MMSVEIREKLALLDRLDPSREIFAASAHQYRLNPRLAPEQVEMVEARIACRLPEQYRRFVTEFGDGGAGPGYGIGRLTDLLSPGEDTAWLASIAHPFPAPQTVEEADQLPSSPPGILELCSLGGNAFYYLVMSGPERGFVWISSADYEWGPAVSESWLLDHPDLEAKGWLEVVIGAPRERRFQFLDWYVDWLEASLERARFFANRGK